MNLGDGFNRRKQIASEIEKWISRLSLAGKNTVIFQTKSINEKELIPIPGTKREYLRHYSIEECRTNIEALIKEDRDLAIRISKTNQIAKAKLIDIDGKEKEMTIPELLVLKNEIAPKMERAIQTIPVLSSEAEVLEKTKDSIKTRTISPMFINVQELTDKGVRIDKRVVDYYEITELEDFGWEIRAKYDIEDKISAWIERIRVAIAEANKTELIN